MIPRRQPGRANSARPAPRLPLPAVRRRIWEQACDLVAAGDTRELGRVLANRFSTGADVIDVVLRTSSCRVPGIPTSFGRNCRLEAWRRPMMTTVGYEIGAVFLLAALLMYGTRSGFSLPGLQAGKLIPIVLGVMVLAFGVYQLGPELAAGWRSMLTSPTSRESPRPAQVIEPVAPPHTPVVDTVPAPPSRSPAKATHQSAPRWKTTVIDDFVPAPTEAPQSTAHPVPQSAAPSMLADTIPSGEPLSPESPVESQHDHRIKRAVNRVGRFLHVTKEKN